MTVYFKLVRIQNLLLIAFTQFVMHKVMLVPILQTFGFDVALGNNMLGLLIAATVLIAAGGYTLNDYFDTKIDRINKPDRLIVGNIISRSKAMLLHQVLTGIGVVCGLLLSYFAQSITLAFIFFVVFSGFNIYYFTNNFFSYFFNEKWPFIIFPSPKLRSNQ